MEQTVSNDMVMTKNNKHLYYCDSRGTTVEVAVMAMEEQPQVNKVT